MRARALDQTIPLSLCCSGLVKVTRHSALFTVSDMLKVKKVKKEGGVYYSRVGWFTAEQQGQPKGC